MDRFIVSSIVFPVELRSRMLLPISCYAVSPFIGHGLKKCSLHINGFRGAFLSQECRVMVSRLQILGPAPTRTYSRN